MKEEVIKPRKISKSKAQKRRARNKRRKKEKQLRRQQELQEQQQQQQEDDEEQSTPTTSTASATKTSRPKVNQTSHQQQPKHAQPSFASPKMDAANAMWQRTYDNSLRWICTQQVECLRQQVKQLQQENEYLRAELLSRDNGDSPDEYITSPSGSEAENDERCDDEEPPEIDEGYLEFMQITLRHREELRKSREQEAERKKQEEAKGL